MTQEGTVEASNILGTDGAVHVGGVSRHRAAKLARVVLAEIARLEAIFTIFDATSAIRRLREQGQTTVPELIDVQRLATQWQDKTQGAFNSSVDALRLHWEEAEHKQELPDETTLARLATQIKSVPLTAHLNLNAIAKGWIVDRSLNAVLSIPRPPENCWVNIGGDVAHQGNGFVTVGIEDPLRPFDNAPPLQRVRISNQALATSGGARRYWTIHGKRFSHVIDPRSGWPTDHVASASVLADDAATADVLATAAVVLERHETFHLIDATPNAACLVVDRQGQAHASAHWPT